jgi:hypothetical protein
MESTQRDTNDASWKTGLRAETSPQQELNMNEARRNTKERQFDEQKPGELKTSILEWHAETDRFDSGDAGYEAVRSHGYTLRPSRLRPNTGIRCHQRLVEARLSFLRLT